VGSNLTCSLISPNPGRLQKKKTRYSGSRMSGYSFHGRADTGPIPVPNLIGLTEAAAKASLRLMDLSLSDRSSRMKSTGRYRPPRPGIPRDHSHRIRGESLLASGRCRVLQ
jgi:hypothetical protein